MPQPPRFHISPPPLPARAPTAGEQHDYTVPSVAGGVGFAGLVVGLGVLTFFVTVGGLNVPTRLKAETVSADAGALTSVTTVYGSDTSSFWDRKNEDRLPVFGGIKLRQ